jgi:thioredoxin-related protein
MSGAFPRLSASVLLAAISAAAWCVELPLAENLLRDGEASSGAGKPIVALVTSADCHYCEVLKESVFPGMDRDSRIILRELALDNPLRLIDFDGSVTDHMGFTSRYGVLFTPTVLFLDGQGRSLAEPLVGVSNVDFYLFYLERRIAESRQNLGN